MIITLFCFFFFGRGAKIPEPPEGHKWQKVIHDNKVKIYNDDTNVGIKLRSLETACRELIQNELSCVHSG